MRVLVTGGAGFVGSNLCLELERAGHEAVALDDFSLGRRSNLAGFEGEVVEGDIRTAALPKDVDAILHQAAITDTTVKDEKLMRSVNTQGFERVLGHALAHGLRLVYASSAAVYGNAPAPQKERDAGHPNNIYGVSKWEDDGLARAAMGQHPDASIVGLRYFNVFGPREGGKGKMASMIFQLYSQIKAGQRPRVFKWGEQRRDQVYVKDIVRANLLALESGKSGVVNAGSGKAVSFNEIISELNRALGLSLEAEYFDNPYTEFYQESTQADLTEARALIGYEPRFTFRQAVEDYVEWLNESNI